MPNRSVAGQNERRFERLFREYASDTELLGKKRYVRGEVEISVDQSFIHKNTEYLVEVDSANMAKLLAGQYVLLNQLYQGDKTRAFFLLIHTYRAYNPRRSTNNLALINNELYGGSGIAFGALHIDSISQGWSNGPEGLLTALTRV